MSAAKVALGRRLFFDSRLSGNGTQACVSCHQPAIAFTDGRARAEGSTGEPHARSAMSLANVAYSVSLTWADPRLTTLEEQALVPMFNTHPVELGMAGHEGEVLARLADDERYRAAFGAAFPEEAGPGTAGLVTTSQVAKAIASFARTLLSGDAPYDRLVYKDDRSSLSDSAWRGMTLFFSDRVHCSTCHAGFTVSGPVTYEGAPPAEPVFHNTAVHSAAALSSSVADRGLAAVTGRPEDTGRFRAPTLRNIAKTAPYMHDGSIATLEEVLSHYAAGGRGGFSPWRSPLLTGFTLTGGEVRDLLAFLESLTDEEFLGREAVLRTTYDPAGAFSVSRPRLHTMAAKAAAARPSSPQPSSVSPKTILPMPKRAE